MKIILSVIPMVILIITNDQEKMKYVLDMVHNTSGEKPYVTKYNDPEFLESQKFSGAVTHWHVNFTITYDSVKRNL